MGFMNEDPGTGIGKGVIFIDRPLREGEESHHYCQTCKTYLHQDNAWSHRCNSLTKAINNSPEFNKNFDFERKLLEKKL